MAGMGALLGEPALGPVAQLGRPTDMSAVFVPVPSAALYAANAEALPKYVSYWVHTSKDIDRPLISGNVSRAVARGGKLPGPWVLRAGPAIGDGGGDLVAGHERCWLDRALGTYEHATVTKASKTEYLTTMGLLETWFHRGERTARHRNLMVDVMRTSGGEQAGEHHGASGGGSGTAQSVEPTQGSDGLVSPREVRALDNRLVGPSKPLAGWSHESSPPFPSSSSSASQSSESLVVSVRELPENRGIPDLPLWSLGRMDRAESSLLSAAVTTILAPGAPAATTVHLNAACVRMVSPDFRWGEPSRAMAASQKAIQLFGPPQLAAVRNHAVYHAFSLGEWKIAAQFLRMVARAALSDVPSSAELGGHRALRDAQRLLKLITTEEYRADAAVWLREAQVRAMAAGASSVDAHGVVGAELLGRMHKYGVSCSRLMVLM